MRSFFSKVTKMKKLLFIALSLFALGALPAVAQEDAEFASRRLETAAGELKRQTVDLVDRTSENLRRGVPNTRGDIEEAFVAHQLDASAGLFQQMVRDNRRAGELREAASILSDLVRRGPTFGSNSFLWRSAGEAVGNINRELGSPTGGNQDGGGNSGTRPIVGRVYWRGTVDDRIQLVIRDRQIETRTVAGRAYPEGTFSFTAALPQRDASVGITKMQGRGNVRVLQQPSSANNYTAIIEIADSDGGAREYRLDIFWR